MSPEVPAARLQVQTQPIPMRAAENKPTRKMERETNQLSRGRASGAVTDGTNLRQSTLGAKHKQGTARGVRENEDRVCKMPALPILPIWSNAEC